MSTKRGNKIIMQEKVIKIARHIAKAENALFRYAVYLCEKRNIPYGCIERIIYTYPKNTTDICILGKTVGRIKVICYTTSDDLHVNVVLDKAILPNLWDFDYKLIEGNDPIFIE